MDIVRIHIQLHRSGEDINIDFNFDPQIDTIDQVVKELSQKCQLLPEEKTEIEEDIFNQIITHKRTLSNPPNIIEPSQNSSTIDSFPVDDYSSESYDESIINDPAYQALLLKQREELIELAEKHKEEEFDLTTNAPQPSTTEDLIVFN